MSRFNVSQLPDPQLLAALHTLVQRDRANLVALLVHIGEVEARGLHRPAGYARMCDYCIGELGMAEGSAYRRVRVAKACRRHPALLEALAQGTIHLSAAAMIESKLTATNVHELIELARGRSRDDLELQLAERFPKQDVVALLESLDFAESMGPLSPVTTVPSKCEEVAPSNNGDFKSKTPAAPEAPSPMQTPSGEALRVAARYPRIAALGPGRHALQATISQATRDKIERARDLLAHVLPSGALEELIEHAFDALLDKLEKRVCAKTESPREAQRPGDDARHIPAHVRRAVWKRDGGRCTFTSANGHRCQCTRGLEYDHIVPRGRGGKSTEENVRLLCRAHNQYMAEQQFGAGFMQAKREAARGERTQKAPDQPDEQRQTLKKLRFGSEDIARGEAAAGGLPENATLEQRKRAALAAPQPPGTPEVAAPEPVGHAS